MSESFAIWWRTRTVREQRLLLAMVALAAVTFAWLLVIRPLGDALSQARERHGAAVQALAEARARAALVTRLQQTGPAAPGVALDALLGSAAAEAGFPVRRIDPGSAGEATIAIDSARPQAVFAWVGQMEGRYGLIVDRLAATANTDQTLAVQVTFRKRGG